MTGETLKALRDVIEEYEGCCAALPSLYGDAARAELANVERLIAAAREVFSDMDSDHLELLKRLASELEPFDGARLGERKI